MRKLRNPIKQDLAGLRQSANCLKLSAGASSDISVEALMVHRAAKNLIGKLSTYFDEVSAYLNAEIVGFGNRKIDIKKSKIDEVLLNNTYADMYDFKIPVPTGLSVDFVSMVEVLEQLHQPISKMYDDTLYPFSQFIGTVINKPEKLKNSSMRQRVKLHDVEKLKATLGRCLNNGNRDKLPFGKVFKRNSELTEVRGRLEKLLIEHKKVSPDLIAKTVKELDDNLSTLMDAINDDNSSYHVTPSKIKELSEICYALANEVSAYSTYTVVLEQAINAVNETNALITRKFR